MAEAGGGAAVWSGAGLTQEELMHKDECIVVDDTDCVVGHQSKAACHRFLPAQPQGILHRAFSVFLFNPQGELLLQQRAADKITFPEVRNVGFSGGRTAVSVARRKTLILRFATFASLYPTPSHSQTQ
jgi:hypothetical protein